MSSPRPSLVSTIGRSYFRSLIRPTPLWAHYYVTRHCNYNCQYCGALDNKRRDPSIGEVKKVILKLKELGGNCVALMGGEPTLRKDIVAIIEFCSRNKVYTQLSTNGTFLLSEESGKTLLTRMTEAGLGLVNLSVDSVTTGFGVSGKEINKVNNTLEALIEEKNDSGLEVMLNCVINKQNIDQVPEMLEFCNSKGLIMATIFVQHPYQFRSEKKDFDYGTIVFGNRDRKKVIETADYLIRKKKEGYKLLEPMAYYEGVKQWINGKLEWKCDGGKYALEIDTDGKVGIFGYLDYLDLNILNLDKNYFEKIKGIKEKYQKYCSKKCIPSCMFCSSYYREHPIRLLENKLRYNK